jgi:hypothetical protein
MENKFLRSFFAVLFLFVVNVLFGLEPSDLDGTWVYFSEFLNSPDIHDWDFSWGKGKRITDATLDFDIARSHIIIPGSGAYIISSIESEGSDTIYITMFYVGDKKRNGRYLWKFIFWILTDSGLNVPGGPNGNQPFCLWRAKSGSGTAFQGLSGSRG